MQTIAELNRPASTDRVAVVSSKEGPVIQFGQVTRKSVRGCVVL